jgi:hypothetical protein
MFNQNEFECGCVDFTGYKYNVGKRIYKYNVSSNTSNKLTYGNNKNHGIVTVYLIDSNLASVVVTETGTGEESNGGFNMDNLLKGENLHDVANLVRLTGLVPHVIEFILELATPNEHIILEKILDDLEKMQDQPGIYYNSIKDLRSAIASGEDYDSIMIKPERMLWINDFDRLIDTVRYYLRKSITSKSIYYK